MQRIALATVALLLLAGCASSPLYLGLAMPTCGGPVTDPKFATGACMTGADYDTARRKAHRSLKKAAEEKP